MDQHLVSHILKNVDVLFRRDFLLEIFTQTERVSYNENIETLSDFYKGKLLLDSDGEFVSVDKYEQLALNKYKITETSKTNIKNKSILVTSMQEPLEVKKGDLKNIKSNIKTTIGRFILNYYLLHYPFGDKIEYLNSQKELTVKYINSVLFKLIIDDKITPKEMEVYSNNLYYIGHFTELCVPNFTRKSLTSHPDMDKKRQELLIKYEEELNNGNAAIMTQIEQELISLDKEWLQDDAVMDFYKVNLKKVFNVQRKKLFSAGGITPKFGAKNKYVFNEDAFSNGVSVKQFSTVANEARAASFSRGAETRDSGVLAKTLSRTLRNMGIVGHDCKTKNYVKLNITNMNTNLYLLRYIVEKGKYVLLTEENILKYLGKTVQLRSPMTCKSKSGFCKICLGKRIEKLGNTSLTYRSLNLSAWITTLSLKKSHGSAYSTYTIKDVNDFVV